MVKPNIDGLLKNFNQNQLREINAFLNSASGRNVKNKLNGADKEKLLRELGKLDPNLVKRKMSSMSSEDIIKIMKNL